MSGPLIPQVHAAEVRAEHARQRALDTRDARQQAQRHAERIRQLAQRMRRRLDARLQPEPRP